MINWAIRLSSQLLTHLKLIQIFPTHQGSYKGSDLKLELSQYLETKQTHRPLKVTPFGACSLSADQAGLMLLLSNTMGLFG